MTRGSGLKAPGFRHKRSGGTSPGGMLRLAPCALRLVLCALLWILFVTPMTLHAQSHNSAPPDQIFLNGNIYTGAEEGLGDAPAKVYPRAQALAVRHGRIVAVGTTAEIQRLKGPHTQVVDLGGRFVMPGFNDAHVHLGNAGFLKLDLDLGGTRSLEEMKQHIAKCAQATAPGAWIDGRGWDETKWAEPKLPTRYDLDAVTGEKPAFLIRADNHVALVNSAALRAAGITAATKNPFGGAIDHDSKGEPTGILREPPAMEIVGSKEPAPSLAQRRQALELALKDATRWGVTSVQDNSVTIPADRANQWANFLLMRDMEAEGKLTVRVCEWLPFDERLDLLEQHRSLHAQEDPTLHTGMLKAYMDGSLGSRTAAMLAPYSDQPGSTGLPRYEQATLDQMAVQRAAAGFQMGFHAIGDGGVAMALQAFEEAERSVRERNPDAPQLRQPGGFRFRIEHAQVVAPEDFARFRQLQIIASMQPNHLLTDMNWAMERIGPERAKHSYAWAEFLKNDVRLAFGTDYPVEPITPFRGLYAAVTRKNEAGTKEYFPEQRISIDQAIAAYTTGAAFAEFEESEKGRLVPGFLADFVVLDRDITKGPAPEILQTKVLRTVVGGTTVYEAK